jgi:hypothetical protein
VLHSNNNEGAVKYCFFKNLFEFHKEDDMSKQKGQFAKNKGLLLKEKKHTARNQKPYLPRAEYRQLAYKSMTSEEYECHMSKRITNFSESGVKDFLDRLYDIGINGVRFRFDFREKDKAYQNYVKHFLEALSDSGIYRTMKIHIQVPNGSPKFKHCLAPFLWPVIAPNIKIYACPHSIKDELEAKYKRESVSLMKTDKGGYLCNGNCNPFMSGLNARFNKNLENNPDLLEAIEKFSYSNRIYPIIKERNV